MKRLLPVLLTGALVFYWPTNGSVLMFVAAVFFLVRSCQPKTHRVKAAQQGGIAVMDSMTTQQMRQFVDDLRNAAPAPPLDVPAGHHVNQGYSQHQHASRKKIKRMLQNAKDYELQNFVMSGNAAWANSNLGRQMTAMNQSCAASELADASAMLMDAALESDPFNFE